MKLAGPISVLQATALTTVLAAPASLDSYASVRDFTFDCPQGSDQCSSSFTVHDNWGGLAATCNATVSRQVVEKNQPWTTCQGAASSSPDPAAIRYRFWKASSLQWILNLDAPRLGHEFSAFYVFPENEVTDQMTLQDEKGRIYFHGTANFDVPFPSHMGPLALHATKASSQEFTVLVTGFEPFASASTNPSWEIVKRLPEQLLAQDASFPGDAGSPHIRIVTYPKPVPVRYAAVLDLVPKLWQGQEFSTEPFYLSNNKTPNADTAYPASFTPPARIDAMIHVGMYSPGPRYFLERFSHSEEYTYPDNENNMALNASSPQWPFKDLPATLETDVSIDAVASRWMKYHSQGVDKADKDSFLRVSYDAASYLCEYIYHASMAHLFRRQKEGPKGSSSAPDSNTRRRVAFLHVPTDDQPEQIQTGLNITLELIRAIATTELETRPLL